MIFVIAAIAFVALAFAARDLIASCKEEPAFTGTVHLLLCVAFVIALAGRIF